METFSPSFESKHLRTPEQEIAFLREKLALKEKELQEQNNPEAGHSSEKAIREVIDSYKGTPHHQVLHKDYVMPPEKSEAIVLDLAPEEHDEKISELLGILQTHGIKNALGIVERMNDPHVQDDFERFLVQYIKSGHPIPGLTEKLPEFKALQMTLFEITLPEKTDEEKERALKEVISSMEQFYSGMMSVDDSSHGGYFAIELAVENKSSDFTFNVAVHDSKKSLFEKQMLAIFHNAKIVEKKNDYNVFNEKGFTVASKATLTKDSIWPLKTYDLFDHDPLNSILNSFSKIDTVGEGAAIQIIIKPQGDQHTKRYKKTLDDIMKGEKISEAISKNAEGVLKYVEGFFRGIGNLAMSKEEKEKAETKKKEASQNVDQISVDQIKNKMLSPTVAINLRIVASASDEISANQILSDIESSFNQFENTHGNKIVFNRVKKNDLKGLFYDFTFRLFDEGSRILTNRKILF